jgi:predicted O-methyltransferase YrrM
LEAVDGTLRALLDRLYQDGVAYDAAEPDRRRRRRNLEPEAASFLWVLLQALRARAVVEVGTSNGYSTIWLADAMRVSGGRLVSVDVDAAVQREAAANLAEARLEAYVELRAGDGGRFLAETPPESVDVLFLDSERPEYPTWWPHPERVLRPGGLLVIDNVLSHPDEVAQTRALVEADERLASTMVPVGKGQLLAVKVGA